MSGGGSSSGKAILLFNQILSSRPLELFHSILIFNFHLGTMFVCSNLYVMVKAPCVYKEWKLGLQSDCGVA